MLSLIFLLLLFCSFSSLVEGTTKNANFSDNAIAEHESEGLPQDHFSTPRPSTTTVPYHESDIKNLNVTVNIINMQLPPSNLLMNQYAYHPKRFFIDPSSNNPQMYPSTPDEPEAMYYLLITLIVMFGFFLFCLFIAACIISSFLCFSILKNK